jgi:cyclopropane fatty-acyl-phospholipid synthase-like methyltransferase
LARENYWYLMHKLSGSSYIDYYARRMDSIVARNPNWGKSLDRSFQLRYLHAHGLRRDMTMLDFGCGALSAGMLFIEYLDADKYFGVDISAKALEEGRRRLESEQLTGKRAILVQLHSTCLAPLRGRRFDVVWAQSVFTHMPPSDIRAVLGQLQGLLHPTGVCYATYASSLNGVEQRRYKDWYYHLDYFRHAACDAGLVVEQMPDWQHPADPEGVDRMLRFKVAG